MLGLGMNHNMFDGIAAMEFLNSWAETARGLPLSVPPCLDRTLLRPRTPPKIEFPHNEFEDLDDISGTGKLYADEKLVYKSLSIWTRKTGEAQDHGRDKNHDIPNPNRVPLESSLPSLGV